VDPLFDLNGEQLWEFGLTAYERGDWGEAVTAFDRFLRQNPGHARGPDVRIHLARAHMNQEEYLTAALEFDRFLQLYYNHGYAPEASIGICRSFAALAPHPQRDQMNTRRAVDACFDTMREFQGLDVAVEAAATRERMVNLLAERQYQDGRFYQRRGLHDSAILMLEFVVTDYPQSEWAAPALLAQVRSYQAIQWTEEADEVAQRLLSLYPDSPAAAELRLERQGSGGGG